MQTTLNANSFITADNPDIQYFGRFDHSNPKKVAFDWPGVYIKATFQGTSCSVILEGQNCFDAFVDGNKTATISTGLNVDTFSIAKDLPNKAHDLLLVKRSESPLAPSFFSGLILDSGKTLVKKSAAPERKIEFIGDSYTAGFANEYPNRECPANKTDSIILTFTNTHKAFAALTAKAFSAQFQTIAYSGRGLIKNYNWIDKGKELLYYYDKTLMSSDTKLWNFSSWKADVVVIGIGINDFQADPPYADPAAFDSTYSSFISRLRNQYPGVKLILCATKIWPTDSLIPRVKNIIEIQKKQGHKDIWYYEYATPNTALYGHPGIDDHKIIADGLIPIISKATGWKNTNIKQGNK
jgi:hypothetical protein